ncbi:efflux RND transporter periplasmic adaptor subunit [Phyllobacterium endophyticum]|uniref:Efflux transporter periplasmic adaptor subunit n=1 Tax=Phyllobacterium endophyticum TaxID=1149773 RepID=A0A2P7AMD7_9HYPH|nr:efflux RND transporter periplasmic adaptor subunit [Phyllobacterium endophyticum]MBB3238403.1 RND family efflux transporter MFP subunit [Phyllobacterium endophyticum]PSH55379.1 efflux transporter periplasmic adaptor subunit [Phyllobacterium endophyticum]TYR40106.1 efflux RND transporter periplasmic adaptor subunit [Phyllobacterium endophyticum]
MVCAALIALGLAGCNQENSYVPPPPPKVDVAHPVKQNVTPYLEATGNTAAVNETALVARVQGFVEEIDYKDGDAVKAGTVLFVIEPEPYQLALDQANAAKASADAAVKLSQAEYERQAALVAKTFATQQDLQKAEAQREADLAVQQQAASNVKQAELNLSYTKVKAPFDGVVTARLVSVGELVGASTTTLASIVEFDPIYVDFNISEKDVLRIRGDMVKRGMTAQDLKKVPAEVGTQTETGYPHAGTLDYVAPTITASTGMLAVRAVLPNADRQLLPGYFVRVRVPLFEEPGMLLVPDRAIGSDQSGRYVLVAGKDDIVEQRKVEIGQLVGELRVVTTGLQPEDRVVVTGLLSAIPGQKIEPQLMEISAFAANGAAQ